MVEVAVIVGVYVLHVMLKMHWITSIVVGTYLLLRTRKHCLLYRQSQMQKTRFNEAMDYMEGVLYAFLKESKVENALQDTCASMGNGQMRDTIQEALDHLHLTFDESDVMRDALGMIETKYPCQRIKSMHDFFLHTEIYGGDAAKPVELLLADKNRWHKCIQLEQKQRRKMFMDIVMSIAASLLLCSMILYLPVMNMDISDNVVSQILTVIVILLDDLILSRAQNYMTVDWLTLDGEDEKLQQQRVQRYYGYQRRKDIRLSIVLASGTSLLPVYGLVTAQEGWIAVGLVLTLFMANQHRIGRYLSVKNLRKSIQRAFPEWLMDIILLLQSENVQMAIMKTQDHISAVLSREVQLLVERMEMEPESARPYHRFFEELNIAEIHSAMSMLYSISMGHSNRTDQQLSELIERNLAMLDAAETEKMRNLSSGMYLLFLAPVLTASLKLVTDMAVFMLSFFLGNNIGIMG